MWLTRLFFVLTMALGVSLGVAVFAAPWCDFLPLENTAVENGLHLIAHDKIVRRTAIACSVGLLVTAWVFFRSPAAIREDETEPEIPFIDADPEREHHRKPPPGSVAGA